MMAQRWSYLSILHYVTWAVLALAIVLRIYIWWGEHSIGLDEANLVRNYVERPMLGLFRHLDYQQYAPPLFSVLIKAHIQFFGVTERSLRWVLLVAGIALLLLFYRWARHLLSPLSLLFALLFLGFSGLLLDYSATECKQYGFEGFVTVLLIGLALRRPANKEWTWRSMTAWAALGAWAVWSSMPSVFILAGIGLYFMAQAKWKAADLIKIGIAGAFWLLHFVVYFFLLLRSDAATQELKDYHADYFFRFPPLSAADWQLMGQQLGGIVRSSFGYTALAMAFVAIGILAALVHLWKTNKPLWFLLTVPLAGVLTASALEYYSLIGRLKLFFVPIIVILVFTGYDACLRKAPRWALMTWVIVTIAVWMPFQRFTAFWRPYHNDFADVKAGLHYIQREQQADESFLVWYKVAPEVRFYTQHREQPLIFPHLRVQPYECCDEASLLQELRDMRGEGHRRIWVLYQLPDYRFLLDFMAQEGRVVQQFEFYRGVAVLWEGK